MLYVDVNNVWRGNPDPSTTIYRYSPNVADQIGAELAFGFPDELVSPLVYEGSCQLLYGGKELERFKRLMGPPIFSYPVR